MIKLAFPNILILCSSIAYSSWAMAENDELVDIFSLTLEELLQVTIASKKTESFLDAPGVITVVSEQQIKNYGARNLRDILDRLVNMQVIGSNLYPHNRLAVRGVTQTHTDNKILLLLNGRVIRDANQGGINTDIYNLFPVEIIKKIEIVRGPGSTLYGTNAFSGIINLITKSDKKNETKISFSAGSFSSKSMTASLVETGDNYHTNVAINVQDSDGDLFKNINGEFGTNGNYPMNKEALQLVFNGQYGDLDLNALLVDSKQGHVKSLFQFPSSILETERAHFDLGYNFMLNKDWELNTNFTYNYHQIAFDISNTRSTRTDSQDYLMELITKGKVSGTSDLIIGVTHESLKGTIGNISVSPTAFDTYRAGIYSQIDWNLDAKNKLVIGAQLNKAEFSKSEISPRLVYIHKLNKDWTYKLLYGEAFRSPFATDMFLDSPTLKGNPDLKPETISTFDAQVIYYTNSLYFSGTIYRSSHEDLHKRQTIDNVATFVNHGEVTYYGIELELRQQFAENSDFLFNASYQQNEDEIGVEGVTFNPEFMLKAGFSHDYNNGVIISLFDNYFSQPTQLTELGFTPVAINYKPEAYHLLTFNMGIRLDELMNDLKWRNLKLSVYLDNLLDEEIYFPSINRTNVSSLPHHSGRNAQLTIEYQF